MKQCRYKYLPRKFLLACVYRKLKDSAFYFGAVGVKLCTVQNVAPSRIFTGHFGPQVIFSCAIGDKLEPKMITGIVLLM